MLPFPQKKAVSIIVGRMNPDGPEHDEQGPSDPPADDPVHAAADHLIRCVKSGDAAGVADALRHAFEIIQREPDDAEEQGEEPY